MFKAMQVSMFERNNSPAIHRYNTLMRDPLDSREFVKLRNRVFMDLANAHAKYKGQGQAADDDDIEH